MQCSNRHALYPSSVSKEFTSSCKKLSEILYHFEPQTGKMGNGQGMRWANKHLTRWQNELPKILANSLRIFCFLPFHAVAPPMSKKNVWVTSIGREDPAIDNVVGRLKIKLCWLYKKWIGNDKRTKKFKEKHVQVLTGLFEQHGYAVFLLS